MSTGYIYSAFGYDEKDGERGHWENWAGRRWWLPFEKVTAIPNFMLRELDHDKSTPEIGAVGVLTYMTVYVPGERIVEELCNKQKPISNRDMGLLPITGKPTGKMIEVLGGWDERGVEIRVEVPEKEATKAEVAEAERLAQTFKEMIIQEYLQSKSEFIARGKGRAKPEGVVRLFMNELGVEDLDDVSARAKAPGGMDMSTVKMIVEMVRGATEVNYETLRDAVESVRKAGKAQLSSSQAGARKTHLDLAGNKAKWDAEHPEPESVESKE